MTIETRGRRSRLRQTSVRTAAVLAVAAAAWGTSVVATADATAAPFSFQPISIQRINLPSKITGARWPLFTADGRHLLFFSKNDMWITSLHGRGVQCLTCGLANDPATPSAPTADLATPFPDGKRVLIEEDEQTSTNGMVVLECAPSVIRCQQRRLVPVDYSAAEATTIPPGGAISTPQLGLVAAAHTQLSPDGRYVGFSEPRSDSIEAMIVGKLQEAGDRYIVTSPRVINPPGPTSATDPNVFAWSNSSSLTEFKTFTNGGADATYVQDGGPRLSSVDVWSVNLKTGKRTLLTSNPDWNEDNGVSPDGTLLSQFSDRTMHYVDWIGGLLPVRDFIDAPASVGSAGALGGWSECMGPMWLLPSTGDDGGNLAGEPLVDYRYPGVHVVDTLAERSQWSPNSTMIALDTIDDPTGQPARFLLVAHLTARKPTKPLRTVSSQPGSWAPAPTGYHGALGYNGTITLHGPGGGTVTVAYGGTNGALAGSWSESYHRYSDNGKDFVTGAVTITGGALSPSVHYVVHLTMTGRDTGSTNADLTFSSMGTEGHATSTYDGNTISGPASYETGPNVQGGLASRCPSDLPKEPSLHAEATKIRNGVYRIKVTVQIAGVGANENRIDTEPVKHATITIGHTHTSTNNRGVAVVMTRKSQRLTVTAGDTLKPTSARLG
jgi:hypothetical protein